MTEYPIARLYADARVQTMSLPINNTLNHGLRAGIRS